MTIDRAIQFHQTVKVEYVGSIELGYLPLQFSPNSEFQVPIRNISTNLSMTTRLSAHNTVDTPSHILETVWEEKSPKLITIYFKSGFSVHTDSMKNLLNTLMQNSTHSAFEILSYTGKKLRVESLEIVNNDTAIQLRLEDESLIKNRTFFKSNEQMVLFQAKYTWIHTLNESNTINTTKEYGALRYRMISGKVTTSIIYLSNFSSNILRKFGPRIIHKSEKWNCF